MPTDGLLLPPRPAAWRKIFATGFSPTAPTRSCADPKHPCRPFCNPWMCCRRSDESRLRLSVEAASDKISPLSTTAGHAKPQARLFMPHPIVIAHHLIWTAYGWWLPNDPRGSCSHYIASEPIAELGELHYGRKKRQPAGREIRAFYTQARDVLTFPLLTFDAAARAEVGAAFAA